MGQERPAPGGLGIIHPQQPFANYISVDSVDEYGAKAEALGGQVVMPKTPVPGMGWFLYFKDPEGNILGLWQHDPAVDVKWQSPAHLAHRITQRIDMPHQQIGAAVVQAHREEIGRARNTVASVIRHPCIVGRVEQSGTHRLVAIRKTAGCAPLHPPYTFERCACAGRVQTYDGCRRPVGS